ncbi:ArsR family transcriptional regulator [Sulfuriferula plumbiphila]|uniref:ArsR family transcriptional regulator n=2 Tax=Sulfuriferula TaxID=1778653 RepID=A0A512L3V9_9PROT|nr:MULTISPECIES: metalloregulator ArsR/SmtB family transcription factor [Sulfuriferula]BBP05547.1 ArsR family transcriptional regulator [Sulfuriferula plumbiphila]GBL46092.1 rhodanese-related sulfurtransferase [Sulfuriferula multivorans]GEP29156.1 ArsR family transcriptional regulator [Sulfuriferula plumbiphila]
MSVPISPKKKLYEHFAKVAKSMASPSRLELLEALAQGERSVEGLANATGIPVANTSHHLQILRDSGVVQSRKEGLQVIYSLNDSEIPNILSGLRRLAERHLAEVERIVRENFDRLDDLKPVKREELLQLVSSGEAVVVDVRPAGEYQAGHIAGAISIPLDSLSKHLAKLPTNQEVVAYCRGPYCMFAYEAVSQLRSQGYKARRLEDGYPEWKADLLPVEKN